MTFFCQAVEIPKKTVEQSRFEQLHFEQLTLTQLIYKIVKEKKRGKVNTKWKWQFWGLFRDRLVEARRKEKNEK
jgi:hypothetical protein